MKGMSLERYIKTFIGTIMFKSQHKNLPESNFSPSIIIASHSTSLFMFNNDPRPALKYSLSSKKETAFSTASTAVPPPCLKSASYQGRNQSVINCGGIDRYSLIFVFCPTNCKSHPSKQLISKEIKKIRVSGCMLLEFLKISSYFETRNPYL